MRSILALLVTGGLLACSPSFAQDADPSAQQPVQDAPNTPAEEPDLVSDEIVRLPAQGALKVKQIAPKNSKPDQTTRLRPGGGLMLSFDTDNNGRVTREEVAAGLKVAFAAADANEDGAISVIEQTNWAESLPTRDETLSNPVRFDPNLDRSITPKEFLSAIQKIATDFEDRATGEIILSKLIAKPGKPDRSRAMAGLGVERDPATDW